MCKTHFKRGCWHLFPSTLVASLSTFWKNGELVNGPLPKGPFTNSPFFQNFDILNPKITERQTYFCTGNVESRVLSFTKNFFLKANQQGLLASWPVMPLTNSRDYIITAVIIHTSQITDYTASTKEKSIWIWPWIQTWQWSQDCRSVHFCWDLFQYPKHRKTCSCQ